MIPFGTGPGNLWGSYALHGCPKSVSIDVKYDCGPSLIRGGTDWVRVIGAIGGVIGREINQ